MNIIATLRYEILKTIQKNYQLNHEQQQAIVIHLNLDPAKPFGDMSCNAAMVLAKMQGKNPRQLAQEIKDLLLNDQESLFVKTIHDVEIAGPGFINITLHKDVWAKVAGELWDQKNSYFILPEYEKRHRYLVEFVSANPTGPLHLGTGRGGIIGDVLGNVLQFVGHTVLKEYYINDAGNQMKLLGKSVLVRCKQALGQQEELPEEGYAGEYIIELAAQCRAEYGDDVINKDESFFSEYAKNEMLKNIKTDLQSFGVQFDSWFSEKSLHEDGSIEQAIDVLRNKDLVYESEGALWFKSTAFGDEKDRVIRKQNGELTYIAADIAYHKNKFDRGYDILIDILGQDHHGYVKRLKGTMLALDYAQAFDVILYQLVTIKENDVAIKMSKRAGTFTKLDDIVQTVGRDVARFFYLNRKADAHLEFDLATALKKTDENPVFYIQYAYVRTNSLLEKAALDEQLQKIVEQLRGGSLNQTHLETMMLLVQDPEIMVLRKIVSLSDTLLSVAKTYQTHVIAYYAWELALVFHNYYANNRIVDLANPELSAARLCLVQLVRQTLGIGLDLLGISKPEKM